VSLLLFRGRCCDAGPQPVRQFRPAELVIAEQRVGRLAVGPAVGDGPGEVLGQGMRRDVQPASGRGGVGGPKARRAGSLLRCGPDAPRAMAILAAQLRPPRVWDPGPAAAAAGS
jgi:hypothetical protein